MDEEDRLRTAMERRKHYEEEWKQKFAQRLEGLFERRGIAPEMAAKAVGCEADRIRVLLNAGDYPSVVEILRLVYLSYDAEGSLLGREAAVRYFLRG